MTISNIILTLLFALFALAQLNDPDPWPWVCWYGLVAVLAGLAAAGRYFRWLILGALLFSLVVLGFYLPDFWQWIQDGMPTITGSMKAESMYIELVREFLGMLLSTLALLWLYSQRKKATTTS